MNTKYDWLLFDADNTLFDFNAAEAHSLEQTLATTDIEWSEEVLGIYREINHQAWTDYEAGKLSKDRIRHLRFEQLLERFRSAYDPVGLSEAYRQGLASSTHLMPGCINVLNALQGNYRLGLITNGLVEVQYPRLAATGIDRYFEVITVSDEIGIAKPHAGFFDHAFNEMKQTNRERVLVIGDNPNADIGGALAYGAHACWMKLPGVVKKPPQQPQYEASALVELLDFL